MRNDILERKDEIIIWVEENQPKAYICKMVKCKPETLNRYLNLMGIDYKGNQGLKGKKTDLKRKTALEYINSNKFVSTHKLRLKLFEDGLKEKKCEECGITEWNGVLAPLQLHHINGNKYDNEFNNLQILCANCHCLTDNHSGKKNMKK